MLECITPLGVIHLFFKRPFAARRLILDNMLETSMLTLVEIQTRYTFGSYTSGAIVRAFGVNKNLLKPINRA